MKFFFTPKIILPKDTTSKQYVNQALRLEAKIMKELQTNPSFWDRVFGKRKEKQNG